MIGINWVDIPLDELKATFPNKSYHKLIEDGVPIYWGGRYKPLGK